MSALVSSIRTMCFDILQDDLYLFNNQIPVTLYDDDIESRYNEYINNIVLNVLIAPFNYSQLEDYINISEVEWKGKIEVVENVIINRAQRPGVTCIEVADDVVDTLKNLNLESIGLYKFTIENVNYIKPEKEKPLARYEIIISARGMYEGVNDYPAAAGGKKTLSWDNVLLPPETINRTWDSL